MEVSRKTRISILQRIKYKDLQVIEPGQDFERPKDWVRYDFSEMVNEENESVAPRWGDN